jgi:hypothetical protein
MTPVNEARELPPGVHPTVAVLPWYVTGTLRAVECAEVADHLEHCPTCRAELESLHELAAVLQTVYQGMPDPSQHVRRAVMAVTRPVAVVSGTTALDRTRSVGDRLADAFRYWFRPKWAPTVAVAVLAVQAGLLVWSLPRESVEPQVTTRSLTAAALRVNVVFNPQATEQDIRSTLHSLGASVIAGPTPDGAYLVEIPPGNALVLQAKLAALRENRAVVQSLSPVN